MRIVFLDQSGQLGGAELMLLDLIPNMALPAKAVLFEAGPFKTALEEADVGVVVVDLRENLGRVVSRNAGIWTLLRALPGAWNMVRQVAKNLEGANVVYANSPKAWVVGALASRIRRVPLVVHLHDIVSTDHFSRVNRLLMVQVANRCAEVVIANSEASARAFVKAGGKKSLVSVIPNGFDLEKFTFDGQADESSINVRREFGLEGKFCAVMAGRLAPWKGQHVFLEVLAKIPELHGLIVGEALFTEEDRNYAAGLPALARFLGCAHRVHFAGFREDMRSVFRMADVVVHCSVTPEPFGRVIVEAMLCGTPVVVSGEGGAAKIVEDGSTGLHHVPGDASSLERCLRRLMEKPSKARSMAVEAQKKARAQYALPDVVERIRKVIDKVCAEQPVTRRVKPVT